MSGHLNRREFTQLTAAAFGGLVTGSFSTSVLAAQGEKSHDPTLLIQEPHVCRGLNTCKGKGADKQNACAGQGACTNVRHHTCHGKNDCKGQGGCGEYPGQNLCKGQGACDVPLTPDVWKKGRKAYEEQMKKAGKEFGDPPPR